MHAGLMIDMKRIMKKIMKQGLAEMTCTRQELLLTMDSVGKI